MLTISKEGFSIVGSGGRGDMSTPDEGNRKDGSEHDLEGHGCGRIIEQMQRIG